MLLMFGLQALKTNEQAVANSLMGRVRISQAVVHVLLQGPLRQSIDQAVHSQTLGILNKLNALSNFLED